MGKKACLKIDLSYDYEDDCVGDYLNNYHHDDVNDEYIWNPCNRCTKQKSKPKKETLENRVAPRSCSMNGPAGGNTSSRAHDPVMASRVEKKNSQSSSQSNALQILAMRSSESGTKPKNIAQCYHLFNPRRYPYFSEVVMQNDGLLFQLVSFLDMDSIVNLAQVSKLMYWGAASVNGPKSGLGRDILYCVSRQNQQQQQYSSEILLPCLNHLAPQKLFPLLSCDRPIGISRTFAYESRVFNRSCAHFASPARQDAVRHGHGRAFEPRVVMDALPIEHAISIFFANVAFNPPLLAKNMSHPPGHTLCYRATRVSYVVKKTNDSALYTVWVNNIVNDTRFINDRFKSHGGSKYSKYGNSDGNSDCNSNGGNSYRSSQILFKERYVPPNCKDILHATFQNTTCPDNVDVIASGLTDVCGLCAILSTPLDHISMNHSSCFPGRMTRSHSHESNNEKTRYILSLVALRSQPPSKQLLKNKLSKKATSSHSSGIKFGGNQRNHYYRQCQQDPNQQQQQQQHILLWQIPLCGWDLFSSSITQPVLKFSNQGSHLLFGSSECWSVLDIHSVGKVSVQQDCGYNTSGDNGSAVASRNDGDTTVSSEELGWQQKLPSKISSLSNIPFLQLPPSYEPIIQINTNTSDYFSGNTFTSMRPNKIPMNESLIHHEFLFIVSNHGRQLRVYSIADLSHDFTSRQRRIERCGQYNKQFTPLAIAHLPWSYHSHQVHHKQHHHGQKHRTHPLCHRQQRRCGQLSELEQLGKYHLAFCGGRLWITGSDHEDLLCTSSSPRLLRYLRRLLAAQKKSDSINNANNTKNKDNVAPTRSENNPQTNAPKTERSGQELCMTVQNTSDMHARRQSNNTPHLLKIQRVKSDMQIGHHHPMQIWKNFLFVVDASRVWCCHVTNDLTEDSSRHTTRNVATACHSSISLQDTGVMGSANGEINYNRRVNNYAHGLSGSSTSSTTEPNLIDPTVKLSTDPASSKRQQLAIFNIFEGRDVIEHMVVDNGTKLIISQLQNQRTLVSNLNDRTMNNIRGRICVVPIDLFGALEMPCCFNRNDSNDDSSLVVRQLRRQAHHQGYQPLEIYHRRLFCGRFNHSSYRVKSMSSNGRYLMVHCTKAVESGGDSGYRQGDYLHEYYHRDQQTQSFSKAVILDLFEHQ